MAHVAGVRAATAPPGEVRASRPIRSSSRRSMTSVACTLNPPERAVVLCVDEKSQIQALDRSQPILPMLPGTPERATHDYKRHGTSSLYAALDLTTGKVIGQLHNRHRAIEFYKFLQTIDQQVPRTSTCTSCSTTAPLTRPRRSGAGSQPTHAFTCTSRQPRAPGSISSSAGSQSSTRQAAQALRVPLSASAERRHPRLDRDLEREPPTVRVDRASRTDPGIDRQILPTNQSNGALARTKTPSRGRRQAWPRPITAAATP